MENIIDIIHKHSLTVRCLPYVVISHWTYREGDENRLKENQAVVELPKWNNRKFIREERTVENGGWWYVKQTANTMSTVTFSRKTDIFFAPTLEDAINMFLDSIKETTPIN